MLHMQMPRAANASGDGGSGYPHALEPTANHATTHRVLPMMTSPFSQANRDPPAPVNPAWLLCSALLLACGGRTDLVTEVDATFDAGWPDAPLTVVSDAVELALGSVFACVRRERGDVWCWGADSLGQLGDCGMLRYDGSTVPVPTAVTFDADQLSAGFAHACVHQPSASTRVRTRVDTKLRIGTSLMI